MRAGLSTIQQTLTPEAAAVLNHSIAEAARRNHGQTTPLHVAATLLAPPSGYLRQACIRSHPNSSHPLQCRALELCFSVALDRLPSAAASTPAASSSSGTPPISNALMAALKRAQAHQRRGCPEQQQQPLLAVKVELEQLIVSILDDPSVSRVMREASFSSPAVKATIEQSMAITSSAAAAATSPPTQPPSSNSSQLGITGCASGRLGLLGLRQTPTQLLPANRNLYLNPRLQQQPALSVGSQPRGEEEVKKVLDILTRTKKKSPVLVGDSEPEALMREVLQRIEKKDGGGDGFLGNVHVISLEKEFTSERSQISLKIKELWNSIETHFGPSGGGGVVLNLGDLKWLVEGPNGPGASPASGQIRQHQQLVSEVGREAVAEMGKLLARFGGGGRVWLIGTASCATYLRCQVYHPTMENDWDLQAVPIAPRAPPSTMFPRSRSNGILSSSVESLSSPANGFPAIPATTFPLRRSSQNAAYISLRKTMCQACSENYEQELSKLVAREFEKSSSNSKPEERQPPLPQWLQAAKLSNASSKPTSTDQLQTKEQEIKWKRSTEELLNKWNQTCSRLHPNSNLLLQPFQPKPLVSRSLTPLTTNQNQPMRSALERPVSPPRSPVRTELVLCVPEPATLEQSHRERFKDLGGCKLDLFSNQQQSNKSGSNLDADSFKRLFKGLSENVGWQPEAASAVAITVMQCRSGNGKRGVGSGVAKGSATWLLFMGQDKVGKKKMASALSEVVFGSSPVTFSLGGSRSNCEDGESNMTFRGKTSLDRVSEAVRRSPFSVFVLENIDQANTLTRKIIKWAIERGRLPDSHGREISLGSAIFILTAESLPENLKTSAMDSLIQCEKKLETAATCGWQLELLVGEKNGKRRAEWQCDEERPIKPRKEPGAGLSLDLNLAAGIVDEETREESRNSSDLTAEHEHEQDHRRLEVRRQLPSLPSDLIEAVDDAIVFKPVDFGPLRRKVSDAVTEKFTSVVGSVRMLLMDGEALDRIVGGVWFGGASEVFDEWTERVLVAGFRQLKSNLALGDDDTSAVRLVAVKDGCPATRGSLPSRIMVSGKGLTGAL